VFPFEDFEPQHLIEFLKQGLLDEYIDEVFRRFHYYPPEVQFNLICYIREHLKDVFSIKLLQEVLGIKRGDAETLLKGEGELCKLVLSTESKAVLSQALVISPTSLIITNLDHLKPKLRIIKNLTGKAFAVFFEHYFKGESFMLPLAVTLSVKNKPKHLLFTGKLNSKGYILEVEHLDKKKKLAKKEGYILITPSQVSHLDTIKAFLEREKWDIPFYVTSAGIEEVDFFLNSIKIERIFAYLDIFQGLEIFYQLKKESFYLITGQLTSPEEWLEHSKAFYEKLYIIKNRLPGIKTFHLAIRGPVALAFALGILYSHFDPFVFYHYQTIEGVVNYHPIPIHSPRSLKELKDTFEYIKVSFEEGDEEELAVILNFSHHELIGDVKNFIKKIGKNPSFLIIESPYKGNLPLEIFPIVAREAASAIQKFRKDYSFKNYHFFFSCPVPVGFMVGLSFGHYADGWIYNYQKGKDLYEPVLSLKELRLIRESKKA